MQLIPKEVRMEQGFSPPNIVSPHVLQLFVYGAL